MGERRMTYHFHLYKSRLKTLYALAFCLALPVIAFVFSLPSHAETVDDKTYGPEFCEFKVSFPETPYQQEKCEDGRCYTNVTYTKVYALDATVRFRVVCNPISQEIKRRYSGEIMQATLEAMTKSKTVKTFETSFREEDNYKHASLVGEGLMGRTPTIFIAQLWIGEQSAFTVEAELTGNEHEEADKLFSEVLRSISPKNQPDTAKTKSQKQPQAREPSEDDKAE